MNSEEFQKEGEAWKMLPRIDAQCNPLGIVMYAKNLNMFHIKKNTKRLVIPDVTSWQGTKYPFLGFGEPVFRGNQKLVSVDMDVSNYTRVKDDIEVFSECKSLKEVKITSRSTYVIPRGTFLNCESLEKVELSPNLRCISSRAFAGCGMLSEIEIPDGTQIRSEAFRECRSLEEVRVSGMVGDRAFLGCRGLRKVTLAQGTKLGTEVFAGCENLEEVIIEEGLERLPYGTFSGCLNLKELTLPRSIHSIDFKAFDIINNIEVIRYNGELDKGVHLPRGIREKMLPQEQPTEIPTGQNPEKPNFVPKSNLFG